MDKKYYVFTDALIGNLHNCGGGEYVIRFYNLNDQRVYNGILPSEFIKRDKEIKYVPRILVPVVVDSTFEKELIEKDLLIPGIHPVVLRDACRELFQADPVEVWEDFYNLSFEGMEFELFKHHLCFNKCMLDGGLVPLESIHSKTQVFKAAKERHKKDLDYVKCELSKMYNAQRGWSTTIEDMASHHLTLLQQFDYLYDGIPD